MGRAANERRAQHSGARGSDYRTADGRLVHLSSGFANTLPWAHADLRIDDGRSGSEFKDIGIRYKGNSSFTRSSITAPLLANFKLKIDLHGTWAQDTPKLRPDRDATTHEQQRVMEFSALCSQGDVDLFRAKIETYLDVDEFLRFIAVNAFISNTDSYLNGGHNFYLYLDPKDDKFRFIPWDQDLSMNGRGGLVFQVPRPDGTMAPPPPAPPPSMSGPDIMRPAGSNQLLIYWLLDDPVAAAKYRAIVRELATSAFSTTELTKLMDALEAASPGRSGSPRAFILGRAATVEQLVAGWAK